MELQGCNKLEFMCIDIAVGRCWYSVCPVSVHCASLLPVCVCMHTHAHTHLIIKHMFEL